MSSEVRRLWQKRLVRFQLKRALDELTQCLSVIGGPAVHPPAPAPIRREVERAITVLRKSHDRVAAYPITATEKALARTGRRTTTYPTTEVKEAP